MEKFKLLVQSVIMTLFIAIPLFISLYGLVIGNMNVAFRSLLLMPFWVLLVLWIDDKIDKYNKK